MSHYPFRTAFRVSSRYGIARKYLNENGVFMQDTHEGIDLVPVTSDKTVVAISSGTVEVVKDTGKSGYGRSVKISHNDGRTSSLYGHLSSCSVENGQSIKAGQKIGIMGSTGNSTGAHLHLSVYDVNKNAHWYNDTINPADYLNLPYDVVSGKVDSAGGTVQYVTHQSSSGAEHSGYSDSSQSAIDPQKEYLQDIAARKQQTIERVQEYLSSQYIYKVVGEGSFGGYQLFGRRYSILVSDENGNTIDVSDLSCEFEINKTAYIQLNTSTITIYNLAPETENAILVDGVHVILQAGYEQNDHFGTIFRGRIYQKIKRKIDGTTYALDLICMSSQRFFTYAINAFSLSANQNAAEALLGSVRTTVFEGTSIDVGQVRMADIVYPRGKVVYGNAKKTISNLAKTAGTTFYFDDETINTLDLSSLPADNEVVYLNSRSGMIGSPEETPVGTGGSGISVQCLLNPLIHLQNLIHVDNSSIVQKQYSFETGELARRYFLDKNGLYRVVKLTHRGATRGNNWITKIEAVSQSGGIAGLLQSGIDSAL